MPGLEATPTQSKDAGTVRRGLARRLMRSFGRLPNSRRRLVFEAVLWLALSRIALLIVPFRVLAAGWGKVALPTKPPQANAATDAHRDAAREIGWAVTRSARYLPFRAVCLPQAIAAQRMLLRRGISSVMHFGVAKRSGAPMQAHAWLDAAGVEVTGYPVESGMVEVARFE